MNEQNPTSQTPRWRHQEISNAPQPTRINPQETELQFGGYSTDTSVDSEQIKVMSKLQGYILIVLGFLIVGLFAWNQFKPATKYEYKVISVQAQLTQKGESDQVGTSVGLKDEELSILGNEGWELVGSFLEMETTHPNFGNSTYVTGLQPNVRPQKAVIIFKRRASWY